jgi:hypothetical protein
VPGGGGCVMIAEAVNELIANAATRRIVATFFISGSPFADL